MSYKTHWQYFDKNIHGRDFCVGDIHGYYDLLQQSLDVVKFDSEKDRLFSVGDLIDRGPQSHKVLEWLDKPWFYAISGNHEVIAMEYFKTEGKEWTNWSTFGGQWFMDLPREEQEKYVNEFKKLPLVFEIDTEHGLIGLVHAECPVNDWNIFKNKFNKFKDESLWGINKFYMASNGTNNLIQNIRYVINGHNNVNGIKLSSNTVYIDTGKMTQKLILLEINHPSGELKAYV